MNKKPKISIIYEKENADGSYDINLDVSEEFVEFCEKKYNKTNISDEELSVYVREIIEEGVEFLRFNPMDHEQAK